MAIANVKMNIEGMMCPHCEARVNKALAAIEGVTVCRVSHGDNCAELYLEPGVTDEQLTKAVTDAGYAVKGVARA